MQVPGLQIVHDWLALSALDLVPAHDEGRGISAMLVLQDFRVTTLPT